MKLNILKIIFLRNKSIENILFNILEAIIKIIIKKGSNILFVLYILERCIYILLKLINKARCKLLIL